jgi:hypothetical protein
VRKCGQNVVISTGPFTVARSVCVCACACAWNFTSVSVVMWLKSCKLTKISVDLEGIECVLSQSTLMTKSENSPVLNPCQAEAATHDLSPRSPGFDPRSSHVSYMLCKVAL